MQLVVAQSDAVYSRGSCVNLLKDIRCTAGNVQLGADDMLYVTCPPLAMKKRCRILSKRRIMSVHTYSDKCTWLASMSTVTAEICKYL